MSAWTSDHLAKIEAAEEVRIASRRSDGTLRKPVTVWAVRHRDDIYVRSVGGRNGHWFRSTEESHEGRIQAGGVRQDVTFEDAGHELDDEIDAAYRTKYRRYSGSILNSVLTAGARSATLKLRPHGGSPPHS